MTDTRKHPRWLAALRCGWWLAMVAVVVLALLPVANLQWPVLDWWDKAQHGLAFATLTAWALLVWPRSPWRIALGMLAFGAGLELAQWAVGWRYAEWADLAADAVGVGLGWVLGAAVQRLIGLGECDIQ